MSLFVSLGQDDIWSLSGISFGSPLNDILEKDVFSLEELLEQDELLQEIKAQNNKLVDFLCKEETVETLIDYVISPPSIQDNELRKYKYPYISCEIICFECPEILHMLVHYGQGKYLTRLFEFLSQANEMNNYLAGYFEKILEMLFRKETQTSISYINNGGMVLFQFFLDHIYNYSIMQIVQRLMLPHIPFSVVNDTDLSGEDSYHCNWSYSLEFCKLLCLKMVNTRNNEEVSSHISDLLITVVQLSPPESTVISNLCDDECLDLLLTSAFTVPTQHDNESAMDSAGLCAVSVLESLMSRLTESLSPTDEGSTNSHTQDDNPIDLSASKKCIERLVSRLPRYFPGIQQQLRGYMDLPSSSGEQLSQSKQSFPRLGHRGLQLVKLVEAVVRISDASLDQQLQQAGVLAVALQLLFHFPLNSLLHLSVQRIVLMAVEGGPPRRQLQHHLLLDCGLLVRIVRLLSAGGEAIAGCPPPVTGHLLLIAQAVAASATVSDSEVSFWSENETQVRPYGGEGEAGDSRDQIDPRDLSTTPALEDCSLLAIVYEAVSPHDWKHFIESSLAGQLARQSAEPLPDISPDTSLSKLTSYSTVDDDIGTADALNKMLAMKLSRTFDEDEDAEDADLPDPMLNTHRGGPFPSWRASQTEQAEKEKDKDRIADEDFVSFANFDSTRSDLLEPGPTGEKIDPFADFTTFDDTQFSSADSGAVLVDPFFSQDSSLRIDDFADFNGGVFEAAFSAATLSDSPPADQHDF